MSGMRHRYLILALGLALSGPALAQETEEEGRSLMEEGARLFWEGIRREMGPALEEFQDCAEEMGPALRDLMDQVGDLSAYHAPEVLPNGDIIIRRKTPQELQDAPAPDGEIEL